MLSGTVGLLPIHFGGEFVQLRCQSTALGAVVAPPSGGCCCTSGCFCLLAC